MNRTISWSLLITKTGCVLVMRYYYISDLLLCEVETLMIYVGMAALWSATAAAACPKIGHLCTPAHHLFDRTRDVVVGNFQVIPGQDRTLHQAVHERLPLDKGLVGRALAATLVH